VPLKNVAHCLIRNFMSQIGHSSYNPVVSPSRVLLGHAGSLKDAQAQLGHAKLSTTLEIYTVPLPAQQRKAVENLSRMVTNGDELEKIAEGLPVLTQQIQ